MYRPRCSYGLVALATVLAACAADTPFPSAPGDIADAPAVQLQVIASRLDARIHDTVALALCPTFHDGKLVALQGSLAFDPGRLRYLGQPVTPYLVMVNAGKSAQGQLRFLSLALDGLGQTTADLRFEVLASDYTRGVRFSMEEAVTADQRMIRRAEVAGAIVARTVPPSVTPPRIMTAQDWIAALEPEPDTQRPTGRPQLLPGSGFIYGDVTLDGRINGGDVVSTANMSVGNFELLPFPTRDFVIAANVAPSNLPGLGEADDPIPPGRNPDGTYTINSGDVVVIANKVVGNPVPVAGEPIPGRVPATNRVVITDSIKLNRTFYRDTIYELQGTIVVGNPEVEDVTLTIQAGTRIEGDAASRGALVIRRGANLIAIGTRLQPIVFTCNATLKVPGCWGGLVINGFSLLNNGDPVDGGVIPVKIGKGGTGYYGGPLVQDSSGVLQYVRIEYAGKPTFQGDTLAGLSLLGVGAATRIDNLQVFAPRGDGIFVSGGTARLRYTLISKGEGDALRWDDGWQGKGQFLVIHQGDSSRHALHGSNFFLQPNALPRSNPILSHITVVGPSLPRPGSTAVLYENGSAGTILNGIFLQAAEVGLNVEGDASCARASDSLNVVTSIFYGHPTPFATDADCLDEAAFVNAPARGNRAVDPGLNAPFNTLSPDYRPISSAAAATGASLPPSDFFFDLSPQYLGAVEPKAFVIGNNIPWYAGWTIGW